VACGKGGLRPNFDPLASGRDCPPPESSEYDGIEDAASSVAVNTGARQQLYLLDVRSKAVAEM